MRTLVRIGLVVVVSLSCRPAAAQSVVGSVALPGNSVAEVSVNPTTDRIYLGGGFAETTYSVVEATDPSNPTLVTTVGGSGAGIVVNPGTNFFYTSNGFGGSVLKFDGTTLAGAGSVAIGACPGQFDVDRVTNLVYVTRQCAGGGAPLGVDPLYIINGATMAIVGNNLGTGGVVGSVRVNSATGKAYVNRTGGATIFGPSPGFALAGTTSESIAAINHVTNRLYFNAGANLVVRDGSNESLITTIPNAAGPAAVNTTRNRIYVVSGGEIKVIDGATSAVIGSVPLGAGVTATGALAADSVKNRVYAVGTAAGAKRLYVIDDPGGVACEVQVSQAVYVNGDTLNVPTFRLTNGATAAMPIELKLWLAGDGLPPTGLLNVGADGSVSLPAGFDQNLGPFSLGQITAAWPRGEHELGCRLLQPVTGATLSESLAPFTIE